MHPKNKQRCNDECNDDHNISRPPPPPPPRHRRRTTRRHQHTTTHTTTTRASTTAAEPPLPCLLCTTPTDRRRRGDMKIPRRRRQRRRRRRERCMRDALRPGIGIERRRRRRRRDEVTGELVSWFRTLDSLVVYSQAMTITNKFLKTRRFDNRVSSSVKMFQLLICHRHFNVHKKVTLSFEKSVTFFWHRSAGGVFRWSTPATITWAGDEY